MMRSAAVTFVVCAVVTGGCSGGGGVSTSSILSGTAESAGGQGAAAVQPSDPTSRAFQVGMVTARATRCGYNFDPVKVKAAYFASEASLGASSDGLAKLEQVYSVAYNGVTKAAAEEPDYCSAQKTKDIKADLARLLAGDYNPPPKKVVKQDDGGVFSGLFGDGTSSDNGPAFGSDDWWEKQKHKTGG